LIIRRATEKDLDKYHDLLDDFHKASPIHNIALHDPIKTREFLKTALQNDDIILLLGELNDEIVGVTACMLYTLYFSQYVVGHELWWWLTPTARGSGVGKALFDGIQKWAKDKGANALFMIALEDDRAKGMEKLYSRAGFKPLERTFIKEL